MSTCRWMGALVTLVTVAACSSSLSIREARLHTLCRLDGHAQRLDLIPRGPNALGLRIVDADIADVERRLRTQLPVNTPTGFNHIKIEPPAPKMAIVVDDLGLHPGPLTLFWALEQPLTYAVLADSPHADSHLKWLQAQDATILVHLPMEPTDPEQMTFDGFFTLAEPPAVWVQRLRKLLDKVPSAVGWSNHMGSHFTANKEAVGQIVSHTPSHMVILDSRTTGESLIAPVARAAGYPVAARQVFLDNVRDVNAIREQLAEAFAIAQEEGQVVAIGHPYPETALALRSFLQDHGDNVHLVSIDKVAQPQAEAEWRRRCPTRGHAVSPDL